MNARLKLRARIILILILLVAIGLSVTLYWIQIVKGEVYAEKAESQYTKPSSALLDRGSIFFSAKDGTRVQVATLKSGYKVYINPTEITNADSAYEALKEYIDIDKEDFVHKATKAGDRYEELASQVVEKTALSIKNLKIAGVGVTKEVWRVYPGENMSAHELGILGENASSTSVTGRYGLERTYENVLKRSGSNSGINAFAGLFSDIQDAVFSSGKDNSGDIISSIEPTTQKYLEKVLEQAETEWHPDTIGGIVMDPNTGEIIAMASLPSFDPNDTSTVKDARVFSNPLVENVYEMGSIIKPLTMATGLDSGAFYPNSTYEDEGTMTLSGKKISNHDLKAHGVVPMQEILSQSLNVGAATIALEVGKQEFSKYFLSFGLGVKTGIDLPNEATGIVGNLKTGRDVEIATAAYGQGIAISPVNVARALSVLANGGYVVTPHLVKEIRYTDGSIKKINPAKSGPVLKKQTTDEVTHMLVKVVDTALLKGAIKNDRYSIAAKTGTAQIPDPSKGGYYPDRYLHSFFGYFPAYNPKYIVFLYQVAPKGTEYAADTLTHPFDQMTKFIINYFNVAPDR
jgi:cell division protein FtsI/penicillin-binding protein 2